MCCEVLDTTDFMRLLSGDLSTFGTYRQQMRRYIIEHVLDDNNHPSSEGNNTFFSYRLVF